MEYGSQVLFILTISYVARGLFYTSDSFSANVMSGLVGAALVFVAQSSLKPYKSPFIRVRDSICRICARVGLIYLGLLVFLLFQRAEDARYLFTYVDPNLGQELPMHNENYDRDCSLSYENVNHIVDFYFWAHFFNWLAAAIIVKDYYVLHIWSILDELIELSLKSIRPNFAECWWDSLILDILLANTLGIFVGMKLIRVCRSMEYDWLGRKGKKSIKDWEVWREHRYFQGFTLFLVFVSLNFVSGFTVPNSVWIPPNHWTNVIRLVIWFTVGALGFRETYDDMRTWGTKLRAEKQIFAQHRWLAWMMLCCEMLLSLKFREKAGNNLQSTLSTWIIIPWVVVVVSCFSYYTYLRFFYKFRKYKDGRYMDKDLRSQQSNKIK